MRKSSKPKFYSMKKLYSLALILLFSTNTFAQSDSKIWIGIDGAYWQKSVKGGISSDFDSEYSASIRPMIGFKLNEKWSIGILTNFQSYRQDEGLAAFQFYNFNTGQGDTRIPNPDFYLQATKNKVFGLGAFIRRDLELSEKFSFNFSLYSMRESGKEGTIERYYQIIPCAYCLSIANPINKDFAEVDWRTGLDLAFAYQANEWLKLELRANLIEFRLQQISNPSPNLTNIAPTSFEESYRTFYGNFTDFGSAVSRDGIRFGLVFTPF